MCNKCADPPLQIEVELLRLQGTWYPVLSNIPTSKVADSVVQYDLYKDRCYGFTAKTFINNKVTQSLNVHKLPRTFLNHDGRFKAVKLFSISDYVIVNTDYDNYALVLHQSCSCCGACHMKDVTILARNPNLPSVNPQMIEMLLQNIEMNFKLARHEMRPVPLSIGKQF